MAQLDDSERDSAANAASGTTTVRKCENCDALIGKLEPRSRWGNSIVCRTCLSRLKAVSPRDQSASLIASPSAMPSARVVDSGDVLESEHLSALTAAADAAREKALKSPQRTAVATQSSSKTLDARAKGVRTTVLFNVGLLAVLCVVAACLY